MQFKWDFYSDQPCAIKDKKFKCKMRQKYTLDFAKMLIKSLFILPCAMILMKFLKPKFHTNADFYGIGVNLDKGEIQKDLIDELGVKNLLIRMPLCDIANIDKYVKFAKNFDKKNILINIIQDRKNIENHALLRQNLEIIFTKFDGICAQFQIANAINRIKWGFFAPKEYLEFYEVAQMLRDEKFPHLELIGPSVIDFEFYYNATLMFNFKKINFDKISALLYVDRRGSPKNRQYLLFDLKNKIDLLFALAKISPLSNDEIYITETNYPLENAGIYAPTSQKECVSIENYIKFMKAYHEIAQKSGKIKRVYWHQLIAPGYGLVDNTNGKIVKMPQFYAYKEMLNENSH